MIAGTGLGNIGIMGQQEWQRRAQEQDFLRKASTGIPNASPSQRYQGAFSAAMASPSSSIFGVSPYNLALGAKVAGATQTFGQMPTEREAQSQWWNKFQNFQFPQPQKYF